MLFVVVNLTVAELKMFHLLDITKLVNTGYPLFVGVAVIKTVTTENVIEDFGVHKKKTATIKPLRVFIFLMLCRFYPDIFFLLSKLRKRLY